VKVDCSKPEPVTFQRGRVEEGEIRGDGGARRVQNQPQVGGKGEKKGKKDDIWPLKRESTLNPKRQI